MGPSEFLGPVLSRPVPGPSRDFPGRDSPAGKPNQNTTTTKFNLANLILIHCAHPNLNINSDLNVYQLKKQYIFENLDYLLNTDTSKNYNFLNLALL